MTSYPKYFDLNLGDNVLSHLKPEDAIKEIISNSLDEHRSQQINKLSKIYKNTQDQWCIKDYGRGIKLADFKFSINPEKEQDNNSIGFYGYGLKDSIGILYSQKIKFKIYTKQFIFTPIMRVKCDDLNISTLHIQVIKNTTYEIKKGTEFVFDNLTLDTIEKAKEKFIIYTNPKVYFEIDDNKMFKLESYQSIFINGVEVSNNTGFHFSYDIKSNDEIKENFNRDRKQLNIKNIKKYVIDKILNKLIISNECLEIIKDILKIDSPKMLQEFGHLSILRNIISKLNDMNKYVFVGSTEKITKVIKNKINNEMKEIMVLGAGIKKKFQVSKIRHLYQLDKFYEDENNKHINTLSNYTMLGEKDVKNHLQIIMKTIEKTIKIPDEIKNRISDIEIISDDEENSEIDCSDDEDDNNENEQSENTFDKYGYEFTEESMKIKQYFIDEKNTKKLFVPLFRYVVNNAPDSYIEPIMNNNKGWGIFS